MPTDDPLRPAREATAALVRSWVQDHPDLARAPGRSDLVEMGKTLWSVSYQRTQDDQEAFSHLVEVMERSINAQDAYSTALASAFLYLPMEQIMMFWASRWADQAFPTFQMGHKYASALMATAVNVDEDSIRPPFKAFLIEVPPGLISVTEEGSDQRFDVRLILVHYLKGREGEMVWDFATITTGRVSVWQHGASSKRMLEEHKEGEGKDWASYSFGMEIEDRDQRVNFLIQRLILNTCLAVSTPDNSKPIGKTARMKPSELRCSAEPLVRTFQVGKPIQLDCRPAVSDYLEGRKPGKKLSVQTLVAGHWRRQAHGPGGTLRKMIWLEPYWRGPEEAPILTRPHKLSDP